LVADPELDIVAFFPRPRAFRASAIADLSERLFQSAMAGPQPVYLAKLRIRSERIAGRYPELIVDRPETVVLRSCLMKPEHEDWVDRIHAGLEETLDSIVARERAEGGG
jgi:hypothetical protein